MQGVTENVLVDNAHLTSQGFKVRLAAMLKVNSVRIRIRRGGCWCFYRFGQYGRCLPYLRCPDFSAPDSPEAGERRSKWPRLGTLPLCCKSSLRIYRSPAQIPEPSSLYTMPSTSRGPEIAKQNLQGQLLGCCIKP